MKNTEQILNIVKNIEKDINRENRLDRMNSLEIENKLLRGNTERLEDRIKGMENYLKVEYVREIKYKKQ